MTRPAWIHTERDTLARPCPICGVVLNAYTSVSVDPAYRRPTMKADDLTRCAYCSGVLVVTTIGFRVATDADLADMDPDMRRVLLEPARAQGGR